MKAYWLLAIGCWLLATGCSPAGGLPAGEHSTKAAVFDSARPWRKPGDVIDSLKPMAELIARFRAGTDEPRGFSGGAPNRESLVRRFLAAVSGRDRAGLEQLVLSRDEFAWLFFPDHPYARPPYDLDPEIFWLQLQSQSLRGSSRVLARLGGKPLGLLSMTCQDDRFQSTGKTRVWTACRVRYQSGSTSGDERLFGSIVGQGGQFKFLSLGIQER